MPSATTRPHLGGGTLKAQDSGKSGDRIANAIAAALKEENKVLVADVVRHDGPGISIAQDLTLQNAVTILNRKIQEEEEVRGFSSTIAAFPYDGAWALRQALEEMFGYVVSAKCYCGQTHNRDLQIVVDSKGTKETVPWGEFHVPGIDGSFSTGFQWEGKRISFQIQAQIKGKFAPQFNALVALVEKIVRERSLYKGKVLNVQFTDDDGDTLPIPEIRFVDVDDAMEPIFSEALTDQLRHDVLAYITHADLVKPLNGGTIKRGVLLAGPYGCGKTLTARWMARLAQENGYTFFYVNKPVEYYQAHLLARLFQPAVIFVEDVETIAGVDRDADVNRLLNVLDGADSKHFNILNVFTTNHGEKINPAMRRPGRIDFMMRVDPPDATAARRLALHYADGNVEGTEQDFEEAGEKLEGKIPATIQEAVARARIRAVLRLGSPDAPISNEDLVRAAESIEVERTSFAVEDPTEVEKLGMSIGRRVMLETAGVMSLAQQNHRN